MNELMLLAENFKVSVLAGVNLGWQGIGGIILFLTGIGLIYFGIKALKGYRFFPDQEQNIPEEDHYEPMQAKALQKVKTTMPSFSGGEDQVFVEWKIGYTVNGEKYTQIVTDNGYNKGGIILRIRRSFILTTKNQRWKSPRKKRKQSRKRKRHRSVMRR